MKYLHIIRHAKAETYNGQSTDIERELIKKGIENSKKVISYLKTKDFKFDLIVTSPAKRAYETAVLFAEGFNYPKESIMVIDSIYKAGLEEMFDILCSLPDEFDNIALVGHNPTAFELVNYMGDEVTDNLPTSSVVSFSFNTEKWSEIMDSKKKMEFLIFPQMIEED